VVPDHNFSARKTRPRPTRTIYTAAMVQSCINSYLRNPSCTGVRWRSNPTPKVKDGDYADNRNRSFARLNDQAVRPSLVMAEGPKETDTTETNIWMYMVITHHPITLQWSKYYIWLPVRAPDWYFSHITYSVVSFDNWWFRKYRRTTCTSYHLFGGYLA